MKRGHLLCQLFLAILGAYALEPANLDPWRSWLAFKEFARRVAEQPDPGVSVQFSAAGGADGDEHALVFLRQEVEPEGEWLEPTGGVVAELRFSSETLKPRDPGWSRRAWRWRTRRLHRRDGLPRSWQLWSYDYASFERFVDAVEARPEFQDLIVQRARGSDVYYEEV